MPLTMVLRWRVWNALVARTLSGPKCRFGPGMSYPSWISRCSTQRAAAPRMPPRTIRVTEQATSMRGPDHSPSRASVAGPATPVARMPPLCCTLRMAAAVVVS